PVSPINYSDLVMVVHPSVPAKDLKEFIALAKAKPGGLNYASSGTGTPYHMAGDLFKSMSGTNILHVPYRGASGARTDLLAWRATRRPRRAGADHRRRPHHDGAQREGRAGSRARDARRETLDGAARRADRGGGRRARLRDDHLARHHGAEGNPAGDRRQAQRR